MDYISVTKFLQKYTEYKRLYKTAEWTIECVSNSYAYDESVCENKLYTYNGIFMELFIRKCLCKRFAIPCKDDRTQKLLEKNRIRNAMFKHKLANAYAAYTDPQNKAMDIIDEIKIVALTRRLNNRGNMEDIVEAYNMNVNFNNLKDVVKCLNQLPYKNMKYKVCFEFEFDLFILGGVPDFIFDDHVFCQIATSKYRGVYKRKYAQVLFYILSHYEQNYYADDLDKEYKVMIFNPLLGINYTTDVLMTPDKYEDLQFRIEQHMGEIGDQWYADFYLKEYLKEKYF